MPNPEKKHPLTTAEHLDALWRDRDPLVVALVEAHLKLREFEIRAELARRGEPVD